MQVYGVDKVWKQLNREGIRGVRCTSERMLGSMGLHGVVRGKVVRDLLPQTGQSRPRDSGCWGKR